MILVPHRTLCAENHCFAKWILHILFYCFEYRGSKVRVHCYGEVVNPNCVHTACNSTYLVRAAVVCTGSKRTQYAIWNAALVFFHGSLYAFGNFPDGPPEGAQLLCCKDSQYPPLNLPPPSRGGIPDGHHGDPLLHGRKNTTGQLPSIDQSLINHQKLYPLQTGDKSHKNSTHATKCVSHAQTKLN